MSSGSPSVGAYQGSKDYPAQPVHCSGVLFHRLGPILGWIGTWSLWLYLCPSLDLPSCISLSLRPVRNRMFHPITYSSFTHFTFISEHPHPQMSFQGWCNFTDPRINGHILTHHISNRIPGMILIKKIPTNEILRIQKDSIVPTKKFPKNMI